MTNVMHWLTVASSIWYKVLLLIARAQNDLAPKYIFTRCENMYPASLPALSDLLITSASSPDSGVYAGIRDGGFRVSKKISFFRNDVCLLPQKSFFFHPQKFPMTFLLLVIDSNLRNSTLFHYFFFHKCVYYFTSSLIIPLFIILNEFLFALYLP